MTIGFSGAGTGGVITVEDAGPAGMRKAATLMASEMRSDYSQTDVQEMTDFLLRMQQLAEEAV